MKSYAKRLLRNLGRYVSEDQGGDGMEGSDLVRGPPLVVAMSVDAPLATRLDVESILILRPHLDLDRRR
jgi:hypothetical protein